MVGMYSHAASISIPVPPSIDTPLHSFLPAAFVDHVHPNAIIALAACRQCQELTAEIFGEEMAHVPWMRPGFELGLAMRDIAQAIPRRARS